MLILNTSSNYSNTNPLNLNRRWEAENLSHLFNHPTGTPYQQQSELAQ